MRIAIFSKPLEGDSAFQLIPQLEDNGVTVRSIFIETAFRRKYSRNEIVHREARDAFNFRTRKHGWWRRSAKRIWISLPFRSKRWTWLNIHRIPLLNCASIEAHARKKGIEVHRVYKHSSDETRQILEREEIDFVLLASSNWLIKEPLLSMEHTRIINAHSGKLPEHRGLDANLHALKAGDPIGVTSHFVDADIDTGPILLFKAYQRKKGEGINAIRSALAQTRADVFVETLKLLSDAGCRGEEQTEVHPIHVPMELDELLDLDGKLERGDL